MCGIVGVVGPGASDVVLRSMLETIKHRGEPEGFGERWIGPGAGLGTNRLAIVDPAGGRQPFTSPEGLVCVVNGEIYNHNSLRVELEGAWRFRGRCDAEVILAAWLRWGTDAFARLRGMWAVAIYEPRTRSLVLARDPLGVKPLYVTQRAGTTWFGSELKCFCGVDADTIHEVPPGSYLDGAASTYWTIPDASTEGEDEAYARRVVSTTLREAVSAHLPEAGVPVACLLSGGIDSSTVLALASVEHEGPVEAWTLAAPGSPSSDRAAAEHMCGHLGVQLTTVSPSAEELGAFYLASGVSVTETWEPALVRNAVSYHFLCRAVRAAGHKFALSGEGADELFGGYDYMRRLGQPAREVAIRESLVEVHRTYLQMADRSSMAATLEVRVPYLDVVVVDRCVRLGPRARYRDGVNKWALRNAFPDLIPETIRTRAKVGMNGGAGYGSNDPGDGIYHAAVQAQYARHRDLHAADAEVASTIGQRFGVSMRNDEEVYNFARYVEAGFHRLRGADRRPRLNTSADHENS